MKKIRLVDQTEYEIYDINNLGNTLTIDMIQADSNTMEEAFSTPDNLTVIQYYAGTELMKGYAGYTRLREYCKRMAQTIRVDYHSADASTQSGFFEETADILTIVLEKPAQIVSVAGQTAQNTADIDYIAMETGVNV